MFFMLGTWPGRKDLGIIDGYNVYMVYTSIVVFFIPVFKFGKQYYAEKGGRTYQIDDETGKQIERGENVPLKFTGTAYTGAAAGAAYGSTYAGQNYADRNYAGQCNAGNSENNNTGAFYGAGDDTGRSAVKICMRCKYRTDNQEFTHCPMCGNKLVRE